MHTVADRRSALVWDYIRAGLEGLLLGAVQYFAPLLLVAAVALPVLLAALLTELWAWLRDSSTSAGRAGRRERRARVALLSEAAAWDRWEERFGSGRKPRQRPTHFPPPAEVEDWERNGQ